MLQEKQVLQALVDGAAALLLKALKPLRDREFGDPVLPRNRVDIQHSRVFAGTEVVSRVHREHFARVAEERMRQNNWDELAITPFNNLPVIRRQQG